MRLSTSLPAGVSALFFDSAARLRRLESRLADELEARGFREAVLPMVDYFAPYEPLLLAGARSELYRFADRDGELLLIDAATSFEHYSSDVTRTMPVNGRFSPPQRELYQIVRDAQEAFVREIRPGVSYDVGSDSGKAVVAKGLVRLGLIQDAERELRDRAETENLERLKWEVDRAVANLFEAINRREQRRIAEAVRRIEADIASGGRPF